uniref:VWFD domain-containing protein n=1 Tax=Electrophorus electricus TaxID=8005 RepID=A0AAY5EYS8_ELEEL
CPVNSHYELCGTSCPAACPSLSFPFLCTQHCQEGCQCNDGFLLSGERCVPPTGCGCLHEGRYRQGGERFWYGEQCQSLCDCDGTTGLVHCVPSSCSGQETCSIVGGEFGCHPQPRATCSASGDPHYISFDGRTFDFQGTCQYILATVCNNTRRLPYFQVSARNEAWNGLPVSITAEVYVNVSGHLLHISRDMHLPVLLDSGRVSIYSSEQNTFISTDFGLSVSYDGSWVVRITVPANYSGVTCGLCGNYNGQTRDDFLTRSGALGTSASQFGASWKVQNDTLCSDGCGDSCPSCPDQTRARTQCEILRDRQGPFGFCHAYVGPEAYFNNCAFDVCLSGYSNDVLCRSIQTYVSACQSAKATIYPWRQNTTCRVECPVNSHYELCGTDCGHTCASSVDAVCERTCSEGCFCNEGFVRSGGLCVPVEQCGCLYNGLYFHEPSFQVVLISDDASCQQRCTCSSRGLQCSSQPCTFSQACRPAAFQYSCQNIQRQTCTISGDPHYYTFDNQIFHFQGTCTYVLSEVCGRGLPYYRIEGKNENRGSTSVAWTRLVRVFVYNEELELVKDHQYQAKVNGSFAAAPFSLHNGSIQVYQSGFSVAISTDFGLVVTYDSNHYVTISVPYDYQNATCGLCGNFNHHPEDDFRTPSGQILSSDLDFANSWKVPGDIYPVCQNTRCSGLACSSCTTAQTSLYRSGAFCGILANSSGPFSTCQSRLAPQIFTENCVYDLCVGGGYQPILCQALNVYAAQCQQQGIQLGQWRRPGFCEIPCPAHSHFETQGTSCPATCSNPSAPSSCPLPNQESCICDAGYVLSAGECVPEANCGCTFEGLYYAEGQSVVLGADCGRQCVCSNRAMSCQNHQCGRQETCGLYNGVRGCRPTSYSTCLVEGLGTYHTFDGVMFSYPGACGLTLTRVMGPSQLPNFEVTVQKVPRGPQDFIRVLRFDAEGTQVSGQVVSLPFALASGRILIYHSSVKGIIMETTFGVIVRADWPHLIRITAPSTYNGSLGGLCGNLNGNQADEFYSPVGVLLNDSRVFGDSWRDGSLSAYCVESAGIWQTGYYQNTSQFTQNCSIMASARGPFAQCHSSLDPRQWVADCTHSLEQTGGARESLCEVLRGYSVLCQQNGIRVGEWRNITKCEFPCPVNSHYELCGTSCPAACPSLSFPFLCTQHCQEGCQCNDGLLLSGERCVPPTGCGCLHEGRYRQGGERFWYGEQCQSLCDCDGTTGLVHCVPSSCSGQETCSIVGGEFGCHPQPRATCSASGDPHYISFDGRTFDFQGTCQYILATVCNNTRRLPYFQVSARNEAWNGLPVSITAEVYVNVSGHLWKMKANIMHLPVLLDSGRVSIYSSEQNTFISTDFGLSVSYDGSWVVRITVPANYSGVTCGLCGNYNGQTRDDFLTRSGALGTSASQFGASWKVQNDTLCSDGCGDSCPSCPDQTRARTQCEILRDRQGPFGFCHAYVGPEAYFNNCAFDVCLSGYSNDVLCRSIQTYVSACQSAKATIYPWRQNTTCRVECPVNSHYELCGTDCGHTCASSVDAVCERTCSEGCFCNEGFVRSGGLCVPVEQCGCLYNGLYFHVGSYILQLIICKYINKFILNDNLF